LTSDLKHVFSSSSSHDENLVKVSRAITSPNYDNRLTNVEPDGQPENTTPHRLLLVESEKQLLSLNVTKT